MDDLKTRLERARLLVALDKLLIAYGEGNSYVTWTLAKQIFDGPIAEEINAAVFEGVIRSRIKTVATRLIEMGEDLTGMALPDPLPQQTRQ